MAGYEGPLAYRQGKPMRPDVAQAFDRMEQAARQDGVALAINSGFRSDAEQAVLFARNPNPKMVAPPGKSLHRNGTELDLGPPAAYGWLDANGGRFHFVQRYCWEAWHCGFTLNARSHGGGDGKAGIGRGAVPDFVPERFAPALREAAQRWNVSATLLAAQLYAESNFNPFAVSDAGAQGLAQFMPATARAYGLDDPFNPTSAINAQAHLMRDLLRMFGSVPLALAAYNAGPAPVQKLRLRPAVRRDPGLRRPHPRPHVRRRPADRARRRPDRPPGLVKWLRSHPWPSCSVIARFIRSRRAGACRCSRPGSSRRTTGSSCFTGCSRRRP